MERSAWPKSLSSSRKRKIQELCGQNPKNLRDAFDAHSQNGDNPRQPLFAGDRIVRVLGSFSSNTQSLSSGAESYEGFQVPSNAFVSSEVSEGSESVMSPLKHEPKLPGEDDLKPRGGGGGCHDDESYNNNNNQSDSSDYYAVFGSAGEISIDSLLKFVQC